MATAIETINNPLQSFDEEKKSFSLISWEQNTDTKIILLKRMISTATISAQAQIIATEGLKPFAEFLGKDFKNDPRWNIIMQEFINLVERLPNDVEPGRSNHTVTWSILHGKVRNYLANTSVFSGKITEALEKQTIVSQYELKELFETGFQYSVIEYCKKKITGGCTTENYKIFPEIFAFATSYTYKSGHQQYENDLQNLKKTVAEKAEVFVIDQANNPDVSSETIEILSVNRQEFAKFVTGDSMKKINAVTTNYLNQLITAKTPWATIKETAEKLKINSFPLAYFKMEIEHEGLAVLQERYPSHSAIKNWGNELGMRNLLRQEELLLFEIWGTETIDGMPAVQKKIPAQLPHLHHDVMRHAEKLLK